MQFHQMRGRPCPAAREVGVAASSAPTSHPLRPARGVRVR
jgi:hypothetical protein